MDDSDIPVAMAMPWPRVSCPTREIWRPCQNQQRVPVACTSDGCLRAAAQLNAERVSSTFAHCPVAGSASAVACGSNRGTNSMTDSAAVP